MARNKIRFQKDLSERQFRAPERVNDFEPVERIIYAPSPLRQFVEIGGHDGTVVAGTRGGGLEALSLRRPSIGAQDLTQLHAGL